MYDTIILEQMFGCFYPRPKFPIKRDANGLKQTKSPPFAVGMILR